MDVISAWMARSFPFPIIYIIINRKGTKQHSEECYIIKHGENGEGGGDGYGLSNYNRKWVCELQLQT